MEIDQKKKRAEGRPKLTQVVLNTEEIIDPYIEGPEEAAQWARDLGLPSIETPPDTMRVEIPRDLDQISNVRLGTLMLQATELKNFSAQIVAEQQNEVDAAKEAYDDLRNVIKDRYEGSETTKKTKMEGDMRVVRAKQRLGKEKRKLKLAETAYKRYSADYTALSRIVNLLVDENETNRRTDSVQNIRYSQQQQGMPRGRRSRRIVENQD